MNVTLERSESQSLQIARLLEQKISSGELAPNSKLSSTRSMADLFSVSQQVIKSTMNILERKQLVVKKPRQGIYVAPFSYAPATKELICLSAGANSSFSEYIEKFLALDENPSYNSFNIINKKISITNFNDHSFAYELAKLAEKPPACLLITIPGISRKSIERCLELEFPVIFIGDFACKDFVGIAYNQIVEDTAERAEAMIAYAIDNGKKNIVVIAGPLDNYFNKIYFDSVRDMAKKADVKVEYIEHTDGEKIISKVIEKRLHMVEENCEKLKSADAIIIDGFQKLELFEHAFKVNGLDFPDNKMVIADGGIFKGCVYVQSDYSEHGREALKHIMEMIQDVECRKKVCLRGLIKREFFTIK